MLSKDIFIKIINACEKENKLLNSLGDILNINPESNLYNFLDAVTNALSEDLESEINNNTWKEFNLDNHCYLYDWMYDYDFGKNYNGNYLIKIDDIEYKPENAGELYEIFKMLSEIK